jgi:hypothetical protein
MLRGLRQRTAGSNRGMIEQAGMPVLLLCVVLLRVAPWRSHRGRPKEVGSEAANPRPHVWLFFVCFGVGQCCTAFVCEAVFLQAAVGFFRDGVLDESCGQQVLQTSLERSCF